MNYKATRKSIILLLLLTLTSRGQETAEYFSAHDYLERHELGYIKKEIVPKISVDFVSVRFLAVIFGPNVEQHSFIAIKEKYGKGRDPFEAGKNRVIGRELLIKRLGEQKLKSSEVEKINIDRLVKICAPFLNSAQKGVQEKNLLNMKGLHDEAYCYLFLRQAPNTPLIGGKIINPKKSTKSADIYDLLVNSIKAGKFQLEEEKKK